MDHFSALADPTRREIVDLLSDGDKDAGTIASHFAISKPAISRHLGVLRDGGIVRYRRDAQRRVYSLDPAGLRRVDEWLHRYRRFWEGRLDALESELEASSE